MSSLVNPATNMKGFFAIVLASLLWGTTGTAASFAPDIGPLAMGAFAMGVGGILLLLTSRIQLCKDHKILMLNIKTCLLGGACVAIYPLAFYSSMRYSGVAIGTVVSIASAPFFAAVLDKFISKKAISPRWVVSFVIGAIGIILLTMGKVKSDTTAQLASLGVVLGLVAGLTYAGYSWAAKQLIDSGVQSQSAMSVLFGIAALVLIPSLYVTGDKLFANMINTSVSLYMAIVPMFIGYLLFGYGLRRIDASDATLITLIEPLIATLLAVLIVKERFTDIGWIGVALVTLCLLLQARRRKTTNVCLTHE